jgi:hypothetical protein
VPHISRIDAGMILKRLMAEACRVLFYNISSELATGNDALPLDTPYFVPLKISISPLPFNIAIIFVQFYFN